MNRKPKLAWLSQIVLLILFLLPLTSWAKKQAYTKEERILSTVPKRKFHDWRLRKTYKVLSKQYKNLYYNAANDGYILPNEKGELLFHRNLMNRIFLVDSLKYKIKKYLRKKRKGISLQQKTKLSERIAYYERITSRFSCRYLRQVYKRWYRKKCLKRK